MRRDESELLQLLAGIRALRRQVHELLERLKHEQRAWAARTHDLRDQTDAAVDAASTLRGYRARGDRIH